MIHYHGLPMTPETAAAKILAGRHAMVSWANPEQCELAYAACSTVAHDNGAYPIWRGGGKPDWPGYYDWIAEWSKHPSFDFALIPDVIDGNSLDNFRLIEEWPFGYKGVPVWHLHETVERLEGLCNEWPRVAIGSSGDYATIGTPQWWRRMAEAMKVCCPNGSPITKLHGLRMLDPRVFTMFPFSSADSTNVARNIGLNVRWTGSYKPATKAGMGVVIADRIEAFQSASRWESPITQHEFELVR